MGSEELDHIIPLLKRPDLATDEENWQALCRPLPRRKNAVREHHSHKNRPRRLAAREGGCIAETFMPLDRLSN